MTRYFRSNAKIEPLFNQWYAWPHLLPPVTAALNVANAHVKVMKSYVAAPQVHAQAVKNPAMAGGQFLDLGGKRADEIKSLLDATLAGSKELLELAEAVRGLDKLLSAEATGFSLEGLYQKVPDLLRGYVELVYDVMTGAPQVRFLEELLYRSRFYDTSHQSAMLSLVSGDARPFVLSTPRLADAEHLQLRIPFASGAWDSLFRSRYAGCNVDEQAELLGVSGSDRPQFDALFSDTPAPLIARHEGALRIRYFGHACVLIETKDVSILTDPAISYAYPSEFPRFTLDDLPERIDYVLLTHPHQDHVLFETLLQIRHKVGTVLVPRSSGGALEDPSLRLILKHLGFSEVRELDELDELQIPGGSVTGVPFFGEHGDLAVRTKLAHLVRLGGRSILMAADSNNIEPRLYERVHEAVGDVDTLFLGMECDGAPHSWLYGPLYTRPIVRKNDQSRRLNGSNFESACDVVNRFNCRKVYVYAMGQEPWYGYIMALHYSPESRPIVESDRLIAYCKERGIEAERLYGKRELS
jgi:L-ascorbate metabolism protein UlaG (beta-lactamase superfamily)